MKGMRTMGKEAELNKKMTWELEKYVMTHGSKVDKALLQLIEWNKSGG